MDRTKVLKAEEIDSSILLYKKLYVLTLIYPPTDIFRKNLTEDMFLKPNQQAFFHVMHYLFRILDANEFKKRFYWPITDKRGEAAFRSATIDYLKHLNEKHNLNWTNIKAYLFITPGGMKFINFLLDLVGFIIQELTKQREKELGISSTDKKPTKSDLERMKRQHQFHKEYASEYIAVIDDQIAILNENISNIMKEFEKISLTIDVSIDDLLNDDFLIAHEDFNKQLYQKNIVDVTDSLKAIDQPLESIKYEMEKVLTKPETEPKYDRKAIKNALKNISSVYEIDLPGDGEDNNDVKLNDLVIAFNKVFSTIKDQIDSVEKNMDTNEFVNIELNKLLKDLQQIQADVISFQKKLNINCNRQRINKQKDHFRTPIRSSTNTIDKAQQNKSSLLSKCVSTPYIRLELPENNTTRLSLLDDFKSVDVFNNLLGATNSVIKKNMQTTDTTLLANDGNATMNRSGMIDPMRLLRTIKKDTSRARLLVPQNNLTTLGSKWKERQLLFSKDNEFFLNSAIKSEPDPSTPFNYNDLTRISRSQLDNTPNASPLRFPTKLHAVKKVQDDTLNLQNLSTSPSGRLDPLIMAIEREANILQVNNENIQKKQLTDVNIKIEKEVEDLASNIDNNLNISNTPANVKVEKAEEEDLFNISDSVLNDVLM